MGVAQRLYEGVDVGAEGLVGLITYMRTDSPRVAPEAIAGAREWIGRQLGAEYLPATPNLYKGKKARRTRTRRFGPRMPRGRRSR
jgi:DNA topoisomerase I